MKTITHEIRMNVSASVPVGHTEESYLRRQAFSALEARRKFWRNEAEYYKQIEVELNFVSESGQSGYLLAVTAFIAQNKKAGITVAPLVDMENLPVLAFCFGLSDLDPIYYGDFFSALNQME